MRTITGRNEVKAVFEDGPKVRKTLLGLALEPEFLGFEVNEKQNRDVIHHCGDKGDLDDGQVTGIGEFGHEEGARAHDWRHELPPGAGGRLNRPGHVRPIPHALHHGDGERTGGDHVPHGGA
jgi:hypothetical protein